MAQPSSLGRTRQVVVVFLLVALVVALINPGATARTVKRINQDINAALRLSATVCACVLNPQYDAPKLSQ